MSRMIFGIDEMAKGDDLIDIRQMRHDEIGRIGEIDRSERVEQSYVQRGTRLTLEDVDWDVPNWFRDGRPERSIQAKIASWGRYLEARGTMWGAFEDGRLVGVAINQPDLEPRISQLVVLHVSDGHRGQGVGTSLFQKVVDQAAVDGAQMLYVSAASTRNTVEFYRARGFRPTDSPDPALYEHEPDDIHMIMDLP